MHDRLRPVPSTAERGKTMSPAHEHLSDALGPRQGPWLQQRSCAKDLDAQQSAFLVEVEHDPADTLYLVHILTHGSPISNAGCNWEVGYVGPMIVGTERSFLTVELYCLSCVRSRLDWRTHSGSGAPRSH